MSRGVFITGIGPVTAFGLGIEGLWDAMRDGRSAVRRISEFDPSGFACQLGAELPADRFSVRDVVPKNYRKSTKVMCRDVELAVGAARAAVEDAGLVTRGIDADAEPTIDPDRFGCHIGAGLIAADVTELTSALVTSRREDGSFDLGHWGEQGMANLTPLWLLKYLPNMLACHVTIVHDCRGPSNTITCCEASSALSLGESLRVIDRGAADACLTGGAEHKLNLMAMMRQEFADRLVTGNGATDPATVLRPFDGDARGTVLGEGGGLLVLECESTARERGAEPYAEVVGFATTQTVYPGPIGKNLDGDGALADAIALALAQARLGPDAIDAIVPFGSSIPAVDALEASAIRTTFSTRAASIPLVTTVPFVGNCAAGNGAVGLCVAARCLRAQALPARLNSGDVEGLDAAACPARDADLEHVLVITPSQGGQNAAVVLRRWEGWR